MFRRRALVYLFGAVILVSGAGSACSLFGGDDEEKPPAGTEEENEPGRASGDAPQRSGPEAFILNEIRISGDAQFVELKNAGSGAASPSGLALVTTSVRFALPEGLSDVAPGSVVVVHFDGQGRADGADVYAPARRAFADAGDEVALQLGETVLDRAAWGDVDGANVYLGTGGRARELEPGSIIARPPAASDAAAPWNYLGGADGSSGAANPAVGVSAFATPDGGLFLSNPSLDWYGVPGGVSYQVEVATDGNFSSIVWTVSITPATPDAPEQLSANPPGLANGKFSWRVTTTYADGSSAVSKVQTFRKSAAAIVSATPGASPPATSAPAQPSVSPASSAAATATTPEVLPLVYRVRVTQVYQRKDTSMLELENPTESGAMAWDRPDAEGTHSRPFCASAAMGMMARFFRGQVSIDRLRYEAYRPDNPRPERDLQNAGLFDSETNRAAAWAFSPAPVYHQNNTVGKVFEWIAAIRTEINAGRPMMAGFPQHMFLIVGYTEDDGEGNFAFLFQDGNGIEMLISFNPRDLPSQDPNYALRQSGVDAWWTFAPGTIVVQEEDMAADGDGDGVLDFDETNRFKTSPSNRDSDADDVPDKEEVRASTWDPKYGYRGGGDGRFLFPPRDHDRDGTKMEMDPDSDEGGCLDGLEDLDHDGDREEPKETAAFKKEDDHCISGKVLFTLVNDTASEFQITHAAFSYEVLISLKPKEDGVVEGLGAVTHHFETTDVTIGRCESAYVPIDLVWQVKITGRFVDEVLSFEFDPPSKGYTIFVTGSCGSDSFPYEVYLLGGGWQDITFTEGLYEYVSDTTESGGTTHLEVKLKQEPPD